MSCRRAQDIDLGGFLLEPRSPEFDDFRAHYPGCDTCSNELARWSELEQGLAAMGSGHPEPETLARYARARAGGGGLEASLRQEIDEHLQDCSLCREELRALRAWAPASAPEPAASAEPTATPGPWWRRGVFRPALASALLGILLLPVLYVSIPDGPLAPGISADEGLSELVARAEPEAEERAFEALDAARPPSAAPAEPLRQGAAARKAAPPLAEAVPRAEIEAQELALGRSVAPAPAEAPPAPGRSDAADVPSLASQRARRAPASQPAEQAEPAEPAEPAEAGSVASFLALRGFDAEASLERATAARFLEVPLPEGFGEARVVVRRVAFERASAPPRAESSADLSALSRGLEADAFEEEREQEPMDERTARVALPPGSFPEAGTYLVEVYSEADPERAPRLFRLRVREP